MFNSKMEDELIDNSAWAKRELTIMNENLQGTSYAIARENEKLRDEVSSLERESETWES